MKLKHLVIIAISLISSSAVAQVPYINKISPNSAAVGETINIIGSDFPTSNVTVFFGGVAATTVDASASLLIATVPYGATFEQISVVNTLTGDIAYSNQKFFNTFEAADLGTDEINDHLSSQVTNNTNEFQTQDLCTCDLDKDGDLDIILSNVGSNNITVFTNTSTASGSSNASFVKSSISNTQKVTNVICGDLDGDGYADLVANELGGSGLLYIYRNTTAADGSADAPVFATKQTVQIPNLSNGDIRKPGKIAIADLDLDGHPELVALAEDDNSVFIYQNSSTPGTITLNATPVILTASENSGTAGLGGLEIADMNNDGFPEIITSNFTDRGLYVFENHSNPGDFSFNSPQFVDSGASIRTIKVGDLDQNGFADIVLSNSDVSIHLVEIIANTSTTVGSTPTFANSFEIQDIQRSWGLDLGDIDGDGDLDIVFASVGTNNFYVLTNDNPTSIAAASYSVSNVPLTNNSRNIKIADLDNDGRPDFVFTNNSTAAAQGAMGIKYNEVCFDPEITVDGSTKLCTGETVDLIAPETGLSYIWKKNGAIIAATSSTLTVTESDAGNYTVAIADACSNDSPAITVQSLSASYTTPSFTFNTNTPCVGEDLSVNIISDPSTSNFKLTGPNNFEVEGTDVTAITVSSVDINSSGSYVLTTTSSSSGCEINSAPVTLEVVVLPTVTVNNAEADQICDGSTLTLTTSTFSGYTYDWKLNGSSFTPAQTDPAGLTITDEGDYSVTILKSGCAETSEERTITKNTPPVASFTPSATTLCEGADISYIATSTGDTGLTLVNTWDFGDGSTATGNTVSHAHASAGTYTVSLTTSYAGVTNCTYTPTTQEITITATPSGSALNLIRSDNSDPVNYEKCEESSLLLRVQDPYTSYNWKTISGTDTTTVSQTSTAQISGESRTTVLLRDDLQCSFYASEVQVSNYINGGISILPTGSNQIVSDPTLGQIINLEEDQYTINLSTDATSPMWTPEDIIDNPTAIDVLVTPSSAREQVFLSGIDLQDCQATDSVLLITPGVRADKSFTPNGDGINDCWQISNVSGTDCEITIFDAKGRKVKDISFSPDNSFDDCVWDGRANGQEMPNGTYYFRMSCSDSENESGGAIFMAR
ncbi:FG-GAP-like repeat-containing protein [Reichenbachiella agariperforans]|uniref:FG-GAP-like repeat-containing protein n=1 Tax=Reichenbachiella agariperforans TaxID=156994 RepID=UPI001C09E121|nr:FG-GAP-like repeat-containing protein [Reichenbachiella agariperforans]MBU2914737.1 VCBS repeat-containing protein [Reichenbachiella agariperforans]